MSDITTRRITDVDAYQGPGTLPGIRFRPAGRALGVSAWGMNVIEIDAGCALYPEHDHVKDGQEEVYVVLAGSATLQHEGEAIDLAQGAMVRVGPAQKRKFVPGPAGVTLLALGGTPGKAYEPRR